MDPDFGEEDVAEEVVSVASRDSIIMTQSCDLVGNKAPFVALCPIYTLAEFEEQSPRFQNRKEWEQVRKGRIEGLHMLGAIEEPFENHQSFVVNFRQIYSLPVQHLCRHAESLGTRWRLKSPYLEHFSQAFARFFMRVGLPSAITPFK